MDWDIQTRWRGVSLLAALAAAGLAMLAYPRSPGVRVLRRALVPLSIPLRAVLPSSPRLSAAMPEAPEASPPATPQAGLPRYLPGVDTPRWQALLEENNRLRSLLALRERRWPRAVAATVIGRDPHRWFQELVLDRGSDDGIALDAPVVAVVGQEAGLVGRVVEVDRHLCRAMLIQDSLSAVAATVAGREAEDGVVEGSDEHEVVLRYLDRHSKAQIGDAVLTSGLGHRFPAGIPIGTIQDLQLDDRELFLEARLKPVIQGRTLRWALILADRAAAEERR